MFSLGCVLYEMLAGVAPFRRATETGTLSAILTEEPPAIGTDDRRVPRELERVISKALAKNPKSQFPTAGELEQALAKVEGRLAPPPQIAVRSLISSLFRQRVLIPTLVVVVLAAVLMGRLIHQESRKSWVRETAIPEIGRLLDDKEFVDAGGYGRPELWREAFVHDGTEIGFAEAMARYPIRARNLAWAMPSRWCIGIRMRSCTIAAT